MEIILMGGSWSIGETLVRPPQRRLARRTVCVASLALVFFVQPPMVRSFYLASHFLSRHSTGGESIYRKNHETPKWMAEAIVEARKTASRSATWLSVDGLQSIPDHSLQQTGRLRDGLNI
jgi:hypothetical protein